MPAAGGGEDDSEHTCSCAATLPIRPACGRPACGTAEGEWLALHRQPAAVE